MSESENKSSEGEASESNGAKTASTPPPASPESKASPDGGNEPKSEAAPAPPPVSTAEPAPDPLEAAKAEAQKFREQLLRTAADFDNFRKRSRREQEEALRRGKEATLKELLPVFDNLERATHSADTAPDVKSVADGLRMVGKQFSATLDRLGIKRVPTIGQPFDPGLHEAIQHVESTEHPPGVIAMEVQAGYTFGDHLIRAALVAVSKGPPAEAPPPASAPPSEGDSGSTPEPSEPN
jgi:molecular chaperone GrpE